LMAGEHLPERLNAPNVYDDTAAHSMPTE
jgi:hypothetical protein